MFRLGCPNGQAHLATALGIAACGQGQQVIRRLLEQRKFEFPVERALFLTVPHRLCTSGSDRVAEKWKETLPIEGIDRLPWRHL